MSDTKDPADDSAIPNVFNIKNRRTANLSKPPPAISYVYSSLSDAEQDFFSIQAASGDIYRRVSGGIRVGGSAYGVVQSIERRATVKIEPPVNSDGISQSPFRHTFICTAYYIRDRHGPMQYVLANHTKLFDHDITIIRKTYTRNDWRAIKKDENLPDLLTPIIMALTKNVGLSVMSDAGADRSAQYFWENFKAAAVELIDIRTGDIIPRSTLETDSETARLLGSQIRWFIRATT
jgi:hypothetical protein